MLRLLPPLTLTRDEADAGLAIIERALSAAPAAKMSARKAQRRPAHRTSAARKRIAARAKRDLLDLELAQRRRARRLLTLAARLKAELKRGLEHPYLRGNTLAMIFEKPSLRTRITFETGMAQLGGHAIYLAPQDIGIGERESVKDVARNLSRWVDLIMIRTFAHETCVELAREATVPVINGLTDLLHPCQLLADLLTLRERFGDLSKLDVAFIGDGFNLAQSWIEAAALARFELRLGCPSGLRTAARVRRADASRQVRPPHPRPGRGGARRRRYLYRHLDLDGPGAGGGASAGATSRPSRSIARCSVTRAAARS